MENYAYLEKGFDPNKLKVAELRNILFSNNIDYNSAAKKAELVDLFNTRIIPIAPTLLEKAKTVKPDSRGILMDSPAVTTPRRGRSLKALPANDNEGSQPDRKAVEQSDVDSPSEGEKDKKGKLRFSDENPFQSSPTPSKSKAKSIRSTKLASASDKGSPLPINSLAVSKPISNPATTTEFSTISKRYKGGYLSMMDTPPHFSQTQKTGTSATPQFSKFMAPPPHTPVPLKISDRPSTPVPASPVQIPASHTAATPLAASSQSPKATPASMNPPPSTPATTRRRRLRSDVSENENAKTATNDEDHGMKSTHRKPQIPLDNRRSSFGTFWLFVFCLFWFLTWYRSKLVEKGYCDEGDATSGEAPDLENEPFAVFTPRCHPCPPHGHCNDRRLVSCDPEFVKQPYFKPPFDFLSKNPFFSPFFPMRCKPDTETKRKVAILVDVVSDILSERAGTVDCQGVNAVHDEDFLSGEEDTKMSKLTPKERLKLMGLTITQLRDQLYNMKDPSVSDTRFDDLWRLTVRDLKSLKEDFAVISIDRDDDEEYILSRNPKYPFVCLIRKKAIKLLMANRIPVISLLCGTTILVWLKRKWRVYRTDSRQATELVEVVLGKLEEQERNHYIDPVSFPMSELSVAQLRDFLLSGEEWTDLKRRERVWNKVQKQIERNSNVRSRVAQVKGEPHRVWEWIGGAGLTGSRLPQMQTESLYPNVS